MARGLQKYEAHISRGGAVYNSTQVPETVITRKVIVFAPSWEHAYYFLAGQTRYFWATEKEPKQTPVLCYSQEGVVIRDPSMKGYQTTEAEVRSILRLAKPKAA